MLLRNHYEMLASASGPGSVMGLVGATDIGTQFRLYRPPTTCSVGRRCAAHCADVAEKHTRSARTPDPQAAATNGKIFRISDAERKERLLSYVRSVVRSCLISTDSNIVLKIMASDNSTGVRSG